MDGWTDGLHIRFVEYRRFYSKYVLCHLVMYESNFLVLRHGRYYRNISSFLKPIPNIFIDYFLFQREYWAGEDPWYPRDHWADFEPMLLSEGAFAAGMIFRYINNFLAFAKIKYCSFKFMYKIRKFLIFSFLKLVHIFSVNPHLGPLQISLGRMIIDIIKFFFIYTLVLFAFGCGKLFIHLYEKKFDKTTKYWQYKGKNMNF